MWGEEAGGRTLKSVVYVAKRASCRRRSEVPIKPHFS